MRVYTFRRAEIDDMSPIAKIADHFFGSHYWSDKTKGRCNYFRRLWSANEKIFYVLEANIGKKREIVGYSSIIPEKPETLAAHISGTFNQYSLNASHINCVKTSIATCKFFWQAIAVYQDHLRASHAQRDEMVAHHITDLLINCRSHKKFQFIAERFSEGGERYMRHRGFLRTESTSATGHELWSLESDFQFIFATDSYPKGKSMIERVRSLLNQSTSPLSSGAEET